MFPDYFLDINNDVLDVPEDVLDIPDGLFLYSREFLMVPMMVHDRVLDIIVCTLLSS